MNKNIILAGLAGAVLAGAGSSFANTDNTEQRSQKNFKKEVSEEVKLAIENNDYDAFLEALPEGKTISEEKFDSKVEFFEAKESGDEERLAELKAERKAEREAQKEAVTEAIENNNYDDFVELLGDRGENITEDHFDTITEIHEAKAEGDMDTVKELRAELKEDGIKLPGKNKGGKKGKRGGSQR